jgi:hypothetical protein
LHLGLQSPRSLAVAARLCLYSAFRFSYPSLSLQPDDLPGRVGLNAYLQIRVTTSGPHP